MMKDWRAIAWLAVALMIASMAGCTAIVDMWQWKYKIEELGRYDHKEHIEEYDGVWYYIYKVE